MKHMGSQGSVGSGVQLSRRLGRRAAKADRKVAKRPNQAGRPTRAELDRRKLRVLEVATELFVANGYAGTSLVEIAKRAGVATRTLYQHFGDKELLFREVVFAREINSIVERPVLEPGDTLFIALKRTAAYACDSAMRYRSVGLMRLIIAESQRFPELTKKVTDKTLSWFERNIASIFEDLASQHLTGDGDHMLSAKLFIDLILGITPMRFYTNWETRMPTDEILEIKIDLFIMGRFGPAIARSARTKKLSAKRRS
jgi:AcrR family transcriptional regulator